MERLYKWMTKWMNKWLDTIMRGKKRPYSEKSALLADIQKAKCDWIVAREKLNVVVERDEIDHAIFAYEAAERRYNMLIRQAKRMNLRSYDWEESERCSDA